MDPLDYFADLARHGDMPNCSGGERCAHKLANVILEYAPYLDTTALAGLAEFARLVSIDYPTALKLMKPKGD